jgi:hypothetical protein
MLDPSSSPSASAPDSNILRPITARPRTVGMAAFCERTSGLGMLVRSRKRSLFALFSPKLWTVLNQYGAGKPCVTDLYELLLGIEFENLSLLRKLRCEPLSDRSSGILTACRNVGAAAGARNGMIQSRRGCAVHGRGQDPKGALTPEGRCHSGGCRQRSKPV